MLPILFVLLWSSGYIFVEKGLQYSDPMTFLFLRLWIAWIIVTLIFFYKKLNLPNSLREISLIGLTGLFAQGVYQIFFFISLSEDISPGILSIILAMQPILILLFYREAMKPIQIMGIFMGFIGVTLTVINTVTIENTIWGMGSAIISLAGLTIGTMLQKKYGSTIQTSLTANLFIQYLFSATLVSLVCLSSKKLTLTWNLDFAFSLFWIIFVISIIGTYLFYFFLKQGKAVSVSSYFYCIPPITALLDYLFFHNKLTFITMIGMGFVIGGLMLVYYDSHLKFLRVFRKFCDLKKPKT